MESRFSVNSTEKGGVENGMQMCENGSVHLNIPQDTVSELINTTSTTCLCDNPPKRRRSLAQLTREALPRLENYRNSKRALKRPSLGELLHGREEFAKVSLFYCCFNKRCEISLGLEDVPLVKRSKNGK